MSDVIRRAIIEIETRQKKSRLESPAVEGFKAQAEWASKAEVATSKAERSQRRLSETSRTTAFSMARDFREGGEGALRMARGLALLSANGSDDLKKLVQQVALAQGAFDVFAGGFKAATHLTKAIGPVRAAVVGVTAALGLGAAAWRAWGGAAEEATNKVDALSKAEDAIRKLNQEATAGQQADAKFNDLRIRVADAKEREALIQKEIDREKRGFSEDRNALNYRIARDELQTSINIRPGGRIEYVPPRSEKAVAEDRLAVAERNQSRGERLIQLGEQQKALIEERLRAEHRLQTEVLKATSGGLRGLGFTGAAGALERLVPDEHPKLDETRRGFTKFLNDVINELAKGSLEIRQLKTDLSYPK